MASTLKTSSSVEKVIFRKYDHSSAVLTCRQNIAVQTFFDSLLRNVYILRMKINRPISRRLTDLDGACSKEGNNDGDHVDCQLELKELGDAVVDVTTPHDGLDNRRKIVISQNDVRRFLGYVCSSDTLLTKRHRR
jgi:hypothetical protein